MCSSLNLNRENSDFTDFLTSDIGSQIFRENMLSIHIETGNIFYDNYNTGESIYKFLMRQQDDTKKIHAAYKDSFSNYKKYFLDDTDAETMDKFYFFTNKNVKYLLYKFNDYLLFRNLPTVPVSIQKLLKTKLLQRKHKIEIGNISLSL